MPHHVKLWTLPIIVLLLALGAAVATAEQTLSLNQNFDGGSLLIDKTTIEAAESDEPLITLAARDVPWTGRWFSFDLKGVEGAKPTFRVRLGGDATGSHGNRHRYVYSLDGGKTYVYFNNGGRVTVDGVQYFTFTADQAFEQDTVRIAYSLPYPVSRTLAHTRSIRESKWVSPTASGNAELIIGHTLGSEGGQYTDELGREIPALPLVGYRITDPAVKDDDKKIIVLTSGTHASETTAHYVLEGKVDFLISDADEAAALRRKAVFYVYPQVNPEGRWAGYMRSAPQHPRVNVNRDWKAEPVHDCVAKVMAAIQRDTGGKADVLIDYHNMRSGHYEIWSDREDKQQRPFFIALKQRRPNLGFHLTRNPDTVRGFGSETLKADIVFTHETAFIPNWTIEAYHALGRDMALTLHEVIGE